MAPVVIGTPRTIIKFIRFKKLGTLRLKILVFDESDQILAQVILLGSILVELFV